MARGRQGTAGFTLLEVLVALALLAITFAAALGTAARSASDAAYLRDRTFGAWVAANELARAQLRQDWPPVGVTRGSSWMGRREWPWELNVVSTQDENVRRLDIRVGDTQGNGAPTMVGYALRPQQATQGRDGAAPTGDAATAGADATRSAASSRVSSGASSGGSSMGRPAGAGPLRPGAAAPRNPARMPFRAPKPVQPYVPSPRGVTR